MIPTPVFEIPDQPVVLPMRRSFLGTPVVTIRINGKPHEFWLDTGASMTLLSTDVAIAAGAKLAADDTLALGVVGGHIEARAIYIDSMAIGPVTVRGLGAALVSPEALRFDQKLDQRTAHHRPDRRHDRHRRAASSRRRDGREGRHDHAASPTPLCRCASEPVLGRLSRRAAGHPATGVPCCSGSTRAPRGRT